MALKQKVTLQVFDSPEGGEPILEVSNLRVDFDIRQLPGFGRAKFTIYNLNDAATSGLVSNEGDKYVTLKTQLHEGKVYEIATRYYVNNAVDELKLPDRITSLYCFDNLRKQVLETPVSVAITTPTFERLARGVLRLAGHKGGVYFKSFPDNYIDEAPLATWRTLNGTDAQQCFKELGREYNFNTYTVRGDFYFMYKPDLDESRELESSEPDIVLTTRAMRSNPKIGMGQASIVSNLDPRIYPTNIIDMSQLITIGVEATEDEKEFVDGFVKSFGSNSKFQAFAVQHKGSNYTADWSTTINALAPSKGTLSKTVAWGQVT